MSYIFDIVGNLVVKITLGCSVGFMIFFFIVMTKNKSKKLLQKRMKKQKVLIKKINKSIKNKSSLKNCENFF